MTKISIYQVFTRLFGNKTNTCKPNGTMQENGVGKMNDFTNHALKSIKELGTTHVWFTGILAHAKCFGNEKNGLQASNNKITKGLAGSPYAITDYYDVDADLAESVDDRMIEFERLIERTHNNDLKVIIDFVPNHVARQYKSNIYPEKTFGINDDTNKHFAPTNDFYYLINSELSLPNDVGTTHESLKNKKYSEYPAKVTGNDKFSAQPSKNDWYETVKLNYGVDYQNNRAKHFTPTPPLWDKMVDILKYWAKKGVDGFRCDMAEMVPVEFWQYAISKLKKEYSNIMFIAEIYDSNLYANYIEKAQFDFLYNKVGLYDTLRNIVQNNVSTNAITTCEKSLNGYSSKMLNFIENHDEQRVASPYFANNGFNALPAMLTCATIDNGAVLTYFGQELGEPANGESGYSGNDGRTTIFDYFNVPEHQKWYNNGKCNNEKLCDEQKQLRLQYTNILNLSISNDAFFDGNFYDLMWANSFEGATDKNKLYTYLRFSKTNIMLVVLNFNITDNQQFTVKIPNDAIVKLNIKNKQEITIKGVLNDNREFKTLIDNIEKRGIWFNIPPHNGIIMKLTV